MNLSTSKLAKYSIEEELGRGCYGCAMLAAKQNGEKVVVKQINLSPLTHKEQKEAEREASLLSSLNHPNIVAFLESFVVLESESLKLLCIVIEYADGGDLSNFLSKRTTLLPSSMIYRLFLQILLAMKYLHDRNILHRDLKPENIFLMKSGVVKLGDLGVAKSLKSTAHLARTQVGTPYYMSPEIFDGLPYKDKSDVWSLGCVLYELLSLDKAFEATNMRSLMLSVMDARFKQLPKSVDGDLANLVQSMLMKIPSRRPTVSAILRKTFMRKRLAEFLLLNKDQTEKPRSLCENTMKSRSRGGNNRKTKPSTLESGNRIRKLEGKFGDPSGRLTPQKDTSPSCIVAGTPSDSPSKQAKGLASKQRNMASKQREDIQAYVNRSKRTHEARHRVREAIDGRLLDRRYSGRRRQYRKHEGLGGAELHSHSAPDLTSTTGETAEDEQPPLVQDDQIDTSVENKSYFPVDEFNFDKRSTGTATKSEQNAFCTPDSQNSKNTPEPLSERSVAPEWLQNLEQAMSDVQQICSSIERRGIGGSRRRNAPHSSNERPKQLSFVTHSWDATVRNETTLVPTPPISRWKTRNSAKKNKDQPSKQGDNATPSKRKGNRHHKYIDKEMRERRSEDFADFRRRQRDALSNELGREPPFTDTEVRTPCSEKRRTDMHVPRPPPPRDMVRTVASTTVIETTSKDKPKQEFTAWQKNGERKKKGGLPYNKEPDKAEGRRMDLQKFLKEKRRAMRMDREEKATESDDATWVSFCGEEYQRTKFDNSRSGTSNRTPLGEAAMKKRNMHESTLTSVTLKVGEQKGNIGVATYHEEQEVRGKDRNLVLQAMEETIGLLEEERKLANGKQLLEEQQNNDSSVDVTSTPSSSWMEQYGLTIGD